MTHEQVSSLAAFEREYGAAHHIPLGPRRERLTRRASTMAIAVQSGPSYMDPWVAVIEPDGTFTLEGCEESIRRLLG